MPLPGFSQETNRSNKLAALEMIADVMHYFFARFVGCLGGQPHPSLPLSVLLFLKPRIDPDVAIHLEETGGHLLAPNL
ncbi:hypothetical protein C0V75_09900 [Tabrizicola sp. TH137]|nr:hypothetical protein C0V75_09900 [Tabrizicola sp. TH137]